MTHLLTVYVTCGSKKEAERIAEKTVRERLAACVNAFAVRSFYVWKKKQVKEKEWALLLKTTEKRYPQLERRIQQLHSDEVPCIVAWKDEKAFPPYANWVAKSVHGVSELLPIV